MRWGSPEGSDEMNIILGTIGFGLLSVPAFHLGQVIRMLATNPPQWVPPALVPVSLRFER
jgi:hypothetical protein